MVCADTNDVAAMMNVTALNSIGFKFMFRFLSCMGLTLVQYMCPQLHVQLASTAPLVYRFAAVWR